MKKSIFTLLIMLVAATTLFSQEDAENSKDPAIFTRMPNHHIYNYIDNQFDKYEFWIKENMTQSVEGHYIEINYYLNDNAQSVSGLQIIRNYTNAAKKIGGQVIYEYEDGGYQNAIIKVVKDSKETWAYVSAAGNGIYKLIIVEKQAMAQDVVADASSMANTIRESGKVAIYGIYFDTGLSALKPESKPALEQIAELLKLNTSFKLYVVGHTDNTGAFDANIKLSMERAVSVVDALVSQYGVSAIRLKACGDGPTSPIATNDTEEGKALNRRVELVKQ